MIEILLQTLFLQTKEDNSDRNRVIAVVRNLITAACRAEAGEISYAQVFDAIEIRDCLRSNTVLATTWHIDDIRDRFPVDTTDECLLNSLQELESNLSDVAVMAGWDVINDAIPETSTCDWCEEREAGDICSTCGCALCLRCGNSGRCPNCAGAQIA